MNFLNLRDKKQNKNCSDVDGERFGKVVGCSRRVTHLVELLSSRTGGFGRSVYLSLIH